MRPRVDAPSAVSGGHDRSRRALTLVLAMVMGVAVLGFVVTLANASSANRVAENASLLHWNNSAQASAALARSAIGQSVFFAFGHELGVADDEARTGAIDEADQSLATFQELADAVPPALLVSSPELIEQMAALDLVGRDVLRLVREGDIEAAAELRDVSFESAYELLSTTVSSSQSMVAERISINSDRAALVAQMTRLLVTLLIPVAALVVYWRIARRQLRERRLEMNAKMAAQREMVAGVSHELRTPLTAIYGFSEILLGGDSGGEDGALELITMINTEAADLTRMVDDLLTAARIDMNELSFIAREFAPANEIDAVAAPFRRAGHSVQIDCMAGTITADDVRFRQILRNLISNSVRHGGSSCVVTGTWNEDGALFVVMDDGLGVNEKLGSRLFEPFVNHGDETILSGSVGLGLAVSRTVARGMGGELSYDRTGGWSRFSLALGPCLTGPADVHETVSVEDLGVVGEATGHPHGSAIAVPSIHI